MKTVLITGANKGIGFETAKQLAQLGYFVYVGSRDKTRGLEANSIKRAKQELETKIEVLDVLINNAGISGERPQNASGIELENVRKVFETNFFGAIQTTQQFIDLLKKSDEPKIVNVSSELGSFAIQSNPDSEFYDYKLTAYCSSKTALNAFTVMLAYEFKNTNFKINSVSPGYTATDLNQYRGTQSVAQGASVIVKYATLDKNGETGKFYNEEGETAW